MIAGDVIDSLPRGSGSLSGHDPFQRVTAIVDLGAVERNCAMLAAGLGPGTELCAVVKADAYGHGMVECADAALRGGATRLAVATATEAFELRERVGATCPDLRHGGADRG